MATPRDFAVALLNRLGLPVSQNNIVSLVAFAKIEGGHWVQTRDRFNPFNSHLVYNGSVAGVPEGAQAYRSWADGLEANARLFAQTNMRGLIDALRRSAPPNEFFQAINQSHAWGVGDYAAILGNGMAAYNSYANMRDPVGGEVPGSTATLVAPGAVPWGLIGGITAIALAGGIIWWVVPGSSLKKTFGARENPRRKKKVRRRAA